ncbi:MAG TPA: hypothetical protein VGM62_10525 [Chthoniobacterales bacterium]
MKGTLVVVLSSALSLFPIATAISASPRSISPPPSVELSSFVTAHIDAIAGPLEEKVPIRSAELKQLQTSYKSRLTSATPAERKQLKAAVAVCKAISKMMTSREQAMLSPTAVTGWPQRAAQYREVINQLLRKEKAAEMDSLH